MPESSLSSDESARIRILEEAKLLEYSKSDDSFRRYTGLAQRMFNVDSGHTIVFGANHRFHVLSSSGKVSDGDAEKLPWTFINKLFCSQGDMCIIERVDCLFSGRNFYGLTNMRSCVAAPLTVGNVQVGALVLFSEESPRPFDVEDKTSFLDIAEIIADVIRERRRAALDRRRARSEMIYMLMHNFRTPLAAVEMSISILEAAKKNAAVASTLTPKPRMGTLVRYQSQRMATSGLSQQQGRNEAGQQAGDQIGFEKEELLAGIDHLILLIESSMTLAEVVEEDCTTFDAVPNYDYHSHCNNTSSDTATSPLVGSRSGLRNVSSIDYSQMIMAKSNIPIGQILLSASTTRNVSREGSFSGPGGISGTMTGKRRCEIVGKIVDAQRKIGSIFNNSDTFHVDWDIDHDSFMSGSRQSHPYTKWVSKVVYYLIMRRVESLMRKYHHVKVSMSFKPDQDEAEDSPHRDTDVVSGSTSSLAVSSPDKAAAGAAAGAASVAGGAAWGRSSSSSSSCQASPSMVTRNGRLLISFEGTATRDCSVETYTAAEAHLAFYSIEEQLLLDIGGGGSPPQKIKDGGDGGDGGDGSGADDGGGETLSLWLPYSVSYFRIQPQPPLRVSRGGRGRGESSSSSSPVTVMAVGARGGGGGAAVALATPTSASTSPRVSRMNSRASFYADPDASTSGGGLPFSPSKSSTPKFGQQSSGIWTALTPMKPSSPPSPMSPRSLSRRQLSRPSFAPSGESGTTPQKGMGAVVASPLKRRTRDLPFSATPDDEHSDEFVKSLLINKPTPNNDECSPAPSPARILLERMIGSSPSSLSMLSLPPILSKEGDEEEEELSEKIVPQPPPPRAHKVEKEGALRPGGAANSLREKLIEANLQQQAQSQSNNGAVAMGWGKSRGTAPDLSEPDDIHTGNGSSEDEEEERIQELDIEVEEEEDDYRGGKVFELAVVAPPTEITTVNSNSNNSSSNSNSNGRSSPRAGRLPALPLIGVNNYKEVRAGGVTSLGPGPPAVVSRPVALRPSNLRSPRSPRLLPPADVALFAGGDGVVEYSGLGEVDEY